MISGSRGVGARKTSKVGAEQCCRASAGRRCCGRSSRLPFGRAPSRRCMRITFRPNLFGRSFGRKLGVLYDDYVKDVFVSACGINKKEDDIVLHTQEVTGSSPVAPTTFFFVTSEFRSAHSTSGWQWTIPNHSNMRKPDSARFPPSHGCQFNCLFTGSRGAGQNKRVSCAAIFSGFFMEG